MTYVTEFSNNVVWNVNTEEDVLSDNEFEKLAVEKNLKELEKLVKKGDVEKIDEIVAKGLYVDNFKWQEETGSLYTGKNRAVGLENILYMCPCCKKEFNISTKNDMIICKNCV